MAGPDNRPSLCGTDCGNGADCNVEYDSQDSDEDLWKYSF